MSEHDLINDLITTYRNLNNKVRMLPEDRLTMADGAGNSVRQAVTELRNSEMEFSQALKDSISGISKADMIKGKPVIGTESESDTTASIISQFGTARESTLAMLRTLTPEEWSKSIEGGATIRKRLEEHLGRDKQSMEQIVGLLGSP